jgi:hypothetical protein
MAFSPSEPTTIGNSYIFPSNSILTYSVMVHPYIWIIKRFLYI